MGNVYACRAKRSLQSKKSRKVLENLLDRTFNIAKKNLYISPAIKTDKNMEKYREKTYVDENDAARLEIHVSSHIKGLVDYLESNHNKLADTGRYISKAVTSSKNPEVHILGLLVLRDLLNEIHKFSYDQDLLEGLVGSQGRENVTTDERRKILRSQRPEDAFAPDYTPEIVEYKSDIMGNVMEFEGSVFEVLCFTCDQKKNPLYNSSLKYSLHLLDVYAKKHIGYISNERIEYLLKEVLEVMGSYKNINNQENLERNSQFLEVMASLARIQNLVFFYKLKFIQYSCLVLRDLYLDEQKKSSAPTNGSNIIEASASALKQETKQKAFSLFEIIAQSLSDLTEFDVVISPIISFFDETHWNDEHLQKDIFVSLQNSMKDNTAFDQIEIFMIEKILEYIDYDKGDSIGGTVRYKNNKDPEVKTKVFSVLEVVLEEARRSFLSFLIIDRMMICFVDNLADHAKTFSSDARVKQSIYNCQRSFIEKISNSSKSLTQVINSVTAQILKKHPEDNTNYPQISALLKFLDFTINHVNGFPSQASLPRDSMNILLKLRDRRNLLLETFSPIEKQLALTVDSEESPERITLKGLKLVPCDPDMGQTLIKNSILTLKALMEERKRTGSESTLNMRFLAFLSHFGRINQSLLERKDLTLLTIQLCSLKQIIVLTQEEMHKYQQKKDDHSKQNSSLLIYFCIDFTKNLSNIWELAALIPHIEALGRQIPASVATVLSNEALNLKTETSDQIYNSLKEYQLMNTQTFVEGSQGLMEALLLQFKPILPVLSLDRVSQDFHEKDVNDDSNINFQDDESPGIQPTEYRTLPSGKFEYQGVQDYEPVKRAANRKESLFLFSQVSTLQDRVLNPLPSLKMPDAIPENDNSGSSFMDASFRRALDDMQKEKEKPMNFSRILNEEIY